MTDSLKMMQNEVINYLSDSTRKLDELEFRFGQYTDEGKFLSHLKSVDQFHSLAKLFDLNDSVTMINITPDRSILSHLSDGDCRVRIVESDNIDLVNIRNFCTSDRVDFSNSSTTLLCKKKHNDVDFKDLNVRFSAASETPYGENTEAVKIALTNAFRKGRQMTQVNKKNFYRFMKRYSKVLYASDEFRLVLDMSVVKSGRGINFRNSNVLNSREQYEVELEIQNLDMSSDDDRKSKLKDVFNKVEPYLKDILRIIQGGISYATTTVLSNVVEQYSSLADLARPRFIGPNINALMSYDLIPDDDGNIHVTHDNSVVTDKADGERHLLLVNDGKAYLLDKRLNVKPTGLATEIAEDTLLDGELLKVNNKYVFLAFDILFEGGSDVRDRDFFDETEIKRTSATKGKGEKKEKIKVISVKNDIVLAADVTPETRYGKMLSALGAVDGEETKAELDDFTILPKHFRPLSQVPKQRDDSSRDSIKINGNMMTKEYKTKNLNYQLDGLIIQIAKGEQSHYPKIKDRMLTWTHCMKWKPVDLITIDFKVEYDGGCKKLVNFDSTGLKKSSESDNDDKYVPFVLKYLPLEKNSKSRRGPVNLVTYRDGDKSKWYFKADTTGDVRCIEDNRVVKTGDIIECRYNRELLTWEPLRCRYDKFNPNNSKTVTNNLMLIRTPISLENLNDIKNFTSYYNKTPEGIMSKLRRHHNDVKRKMYEENKKSDTKQVLLDLGASSFKDAHKWLDNDYTDVVAVDTQLQDLKRGQERLRNVLRRRKKQGLSVDITVKDIKADFSIPFDRQTNYRLPANIKSFTHVVAFFSMHYALATRNNFESFCYNVSNKLEKGGVFMGTCFNKQNILDLFNRLKDGTIISDDDSRVILDGTKIIGEVKDSRIWQIDITQETQSKTFGAEINVFVSSIGKQHREFMVPLTGVGNEELASVTSKYGLEGLDVNQFPTDDSVYSDMTIAEKEFSKLNSCFKFTKSDKEIDWDKLRDNLTDSPSTIPKATPRPKATATAKATAKPKATATAKATETAKATAKPKAKAKKLKFKIKKPKPSTKE